MSTQNKFLMDFETRCRFAYIRILVDRQYSCEVTLNTGIFAVVQLGKKPELDQYNLNKINVWTYRVVAGLLKY